MNQFFITLLFLVGQLFSQSSKAQIIKQLKSPNGKITLDFQYTSDGNLSYQMAVLGKLVVKNSPLGYEAANAVTIPSKGWALKVSNQRSVNTAWKPVWGKRTIVPDQYNELSLDMMGQNSASLNHLRLMARVYNDGVAFRYLIPAEEQNILMATTELTKYNFAGDYTAWYYNFEYHNVGPEKLSESDGTRYPVITIKVDKQTYLAVHEADLETGDPLVLQSKKGSTSFSVLSVPDKLAGGYKSAWRVILCGNSPGSLVDSHLIELLNPEAKGDFSWVKPGVALWDWRIDGAQVDGFTYGMNYPSWVRMVDFAAENNIRYLVLDANWYGPEHEANSDPVNGDKANDVKKLLQYGKEKGIGIWLYLNDVGGRKFPVEQTLKQYSEWGAAGIKYGFMSGTPSEKNTWTRKITALCAQNKLLCDFHDGPVHPYGQMRTYPNAVTREFCEAQSDSHRTMAPITFVTSVFVNMVAGPIDMSNGMFELHQGKTTRVDENQPVPSTLVSEAARTLIVFSGATIIPDVPEFYRKYPDLFQFIAAQKMPWKESKTIAGEIGEYIVMARQAADDVWLVGAATNESGRDIAIPLNFLSSGKYEVTIIQDGKNAHFLTNREVFKIEKITAVLTDKVTVKLAPGGGACLIIKQMK